MDFPALSFPPPLRRLLTVLLVPILFFPGCRSGPAEAGDTIAAESASKSRSLLEEKLIRTLEMERKLDEVAASAEADSPEVQRRFHEVARRYADLLASSPRHLETRLLYGKLLLRYGDREGARQQFLAAARIDPKIAVIHQQLGTIAAEQDDPTRALAYYLNAIQLEPDTAAYHFGLGQLLAAFRPTFLEEEVFSPARFDDKLLEAFRNARDLEPENLAYQFRYGEAFYDVADPDWRAALDHWNRIRQRSDLSALQRESVRLHRAHCFLRLGKTDKAAPLLQYVDHPALESTLRSLREQLSAFPPAS